MTGADEQLPAFLQDIFGFGVKLVEYTIGNRHHDYLVLLARLERPSLDVVIKLAGPQAPYPCPFDRTAALHRLVAAHTTIPMAAIVAVDVSYRRWPWRYLVKTQVSGHEWAAIHPHLSDGERADAHRQLGDAVAQLHRIRFPAFGELAGDGRLAVEQSFATALRERASRFIGNPRLLDLFLSVVDRHAHLFAEIRTATLCHEDLHHHNILFEQRAGRWHLATILDFDKAWAGHHEVDLARLDLWTAMTSPAFWQAYQAVHPVAAHYYQRRPIYQLGWCLEYAQPTPEHLATTRQLCTQLAIPPIERFDQ